jgi:hypothetical protein
MLRLEGSCIRMGFDIFQFNLMPECKSVGSFEGVDGGC